MDKVVRVVKVEDDITDKNETDFKEIQLKAVAFVMSIPTFKTNALTGVFCRRWRLQRLAPLWIA